MPEFGSDRVETLPIPVPASAWSALLSAPSQGRKWPGVARAAATVALPGLGGLAFGSGSVSAVATLGAFAVVYGEGRPYRVRWRVVALVGVVLVVLAGLGASVGALVHALDASPGWWLLMIGVMTAVVAVGAYAVDALRTGPPGAFLPLLCVVIASTLPSEGVPVPSVLGWTALGAVSALVVAMSGFPFRPRTPERTAVGDAVRDVEAMLAENSPPRRRDAVRSLHGAWQCLHDAGLVRTVPGEPPHALVRTLHAAHLRCAAALHGVPHDAASPEDDLHAHMPLRRPQAGHLLARAWNPHGRTATILVRLLVACPVAGVLALVLDTGRPDWAVITTAMILHQGPDRVLGTHRAAHRFLGTVAGLVLLAALWYLEPRGAALVLVLAALMAAIEAFLVRHYGIAMAAITPLAMILGGTGLPGDLGPAIRDRMIETVIGVAVALAVMWGVLPRAHRRILSDADARVAAGVANLAHETGETERRRLRRDLAFDLQASTAAAIGAAHTEPRWTAERWTEHHALHEQGYRLLAAPSGSD
ncbi:FUSC family protein [Rhodococcus triatomae]